MDNKGYRIELFYGVPSHLKIFLENRYQSMYVTLSYFKEIKRIGNLQTFLLYYYNELCEVFVFEFISKECVLWNRVVDIEPERLDLFSQWIFRNSCHIQKISFRDLIIPCQTRYSICYSCSSDIYIKLPETLAEYDAMLGKKSKTQFKYYIKKAQREIADVRININARHACFDDTLFEEIVSLKERRFEDKMQQNSFKETKAMQYAQFAKEYGRITVISASDKIIGSLLCYKVCGKYFATLVAFDIDYAKYSLGRTVFYLAIQGAIEEKACEFHFLWGGSDYVTHYGGEKHQLYTTHVFRGYNYYYAVSWYVVKMKLLVNRLKGNVWVKKIIPIYHAIIYRFGKYISVVK